MTTEPPYIPPTHIAAILIYTLRGDGKVEIQNGSPNSQVVDFNVVPNSVQQQLQSSTTVMVDPNQDNSITSLLGDTTGDNIKIRVY